MKEQKAIYHVFIAYTDKQGKKEIHIDMNCPEEWVKEKIAFPFMKNNPFLLGGKFVSPSNIESIYVFKSYKRYQELILPNGISPIEGEFYYILDCFSSGKVKDVYLVTESFIFSPPEEREKPISSITEEVSKKVFIVHGRDDKPALLLQKYLRDKLEIDAVMFDDLPDKGRTIIEQLEYIKNNVCYAFVIATPDDLGCLREDLKKVLKEFFLSFKTLEEKNKGVEDVIFELLKKRARQNVVFELGLFMGALGRENVCCLLQKDVEEKPSDIDGILYKSFDKSVEEIFHEIADELKKD